MAGDPQIKIYVPRDSGAVSVGAEDVALAMDRALADTNATVVRNGSRGLYWLEPLVEVETDRGRVAYGPVTPGDVAGLLEQGLLQGAPTHSLCLGLTDQIPYLKNQQRLTFARAGVIDPLNLEEYCEVGGYRGLRRALTMTGQELVEEVKNSGLRGRGGAAFPTGIKWQTVLNTPARQKYIVCNADEGDSGSFADRLQMEADPLALIEGMTIAGLAVGADQGYIYLREEYPTALEILEAALSLAREKNYLGGNILGSGKSFDVELRIGARAYICGEETALLESLEGRRGMVRPKPPLPAMAGLFGQPTVVNNVLSLSSVTFILAEGAQAYQVVGMGRSRGTMPFQLAGNLKHPGLVELAFGVTLRELLYEYGGGSNTGLPLRAVQVGGPLGAYIPESQWDVPMDYEAMAELRAVLGHGGIVAFDERVDMSEQARFAMAFCADESCGKCTPCRIGSTRGVEVIDHICSNRDREANVKLLEDLCETMGKASLCAMGGMTPIPVRSALRHFPEDFQKS
ncbi:MAG: formate dehydrogenase [Halieaceae bacterium]|jgi:formate dehydrogenase iron-sulfur subunit|nr:formate dehydrogenase [Halieaceae bacterium]